MRARVYVRVCGVKRENNIKNKVNDRIIRHYSHQVSRQLLSLVLMLYYILRETILGCSLILFMWKDSNNGSTIYIFIRESFRFTTMIIGVSLCKLTTVE